jgi:hypothetical protein
MGYKMSRLGERILYIRSGQKFFDWLTDFEKNDKEETPPGLKVQMSVPCSNDVYSVYKGRYASCL